MNIVDVLLVLFALWAAVRGHALGLLRQAGSTLGLLIGMAVGSVLAGIAITHEHSLQTKFTTGVLAVLFLGIAGMILGERLGLQAKLRLKPKRVIDKFDGYLGSAMGAVTVVIGLWLLASVGMLGLTGWSGQALRGSHILNTLSSYLPPATKIFSTFDSLIDPNHFPEVVSGLEPLPKSKVNIPALGSFGPVVQTAEASVVRVSGTGCGGIVEGTGFIVAPGDVATNAHVIAGVQRPKVTDQTGAVHDTAVMWFDPELDLALLRVSGLNGQSLIVDSTEHDSGTTGVVIGYPGGGGLDAQPVAITNHFLALGRDIYDQNKTERDVYSLQAHIIPGNSGGPILSSDGKVLGIVFGASTTYNNVGYALTGHQIADELSQAEHSTQTHRTGACSEDT